jgi:fructose-1,6-bisphosphatase/inositol monophosphatase family enzyme
MSYATELAFAEKLAREAGGIMRRYFKSEELGTTWKKDDSPVTVADTTINSMVIKRVQEAFPDDGILGEEESFEPTRDRIWVVDPIDGTVPFSLDIPASTFLLALVNKSDGQPVVAVVYDPYLDHLYTATKGGGAFMNGKRLQTSDRTELLQNYVSVYGSTFKTDNVHYKPGSLLEQLQAAGSRNLAFASGAYTAAKVAEGRFATVICGKPGWPWDDAAICLLVKEAGGVVTDIEGNSRRYDEPGVGCVLSANQEIHDQILKLIKG